MVKVAVGPTAVATTTVISRKVTLSVSLLSKTTLLLSAMMTTCCGPSLLKVTLIVSSTSAFGLTIVVVLPLKLVPSGKATVTWNTGAGASPVFATRTMNGTVANFCTESRITVLLLVATDETTRLGRSGVGVMLGVNVTVGVMPGTLVAVGCGGRVAVGGGCANFVCVA